MIRKSPIKHRVHTYKKENGKTIQNFLRGKGQHQTNLANPTPKHQPILTLEQKSLLELIGEKGYRIDVVEICVEHTALRQLNKMGLIELLPSDKFLHPKLEKGNIIHWQLTEKGRGYINA